MPETTKCEAKAGGACEKKDAPPPTTEQKKLKPCCACPETKQVRDKCIMDFGEEHCGKLIEAHKECMRSLGFNI